MAPTVPNRETSVSYILRTLRPTPPMQITASLVWEPPDAIKTTFSLQSSYKFDKAATADASGLKERSHAHGPCTHSCSIHS